MKDFNSSDLFYRYDCSDNVSLNGDIVKFRNLLFSKLFILPFARYTYLSEILSDAYSLLDESFQTLIIFVPTDNVVSQGFNTFNADFLLELSGIIQIDFEKLEFIRSMFTVSEHDFDFEYAEVLKIHFDFIRSMYPNLKILPLFYNQLGKDMVSGVLNTFWERSAFVFLSNMSCGFNYNDAKKNDNFIAHSIENLKERDYSIEDFTACCILNELLKFVRGKGFSFIRLGLLNSGDVNSNFMFTKGFGAWFLYEGCCADLLNKYFRQDIKDFVWFNLAKVLNFDTGMCFKLPQIFNQEFKIFVSFEKHGVVRGVSGSYKTSEPLYKALVKRSFGAAFSDNRFSPLRIEELNDIKIFVTIVDNNIMDSVSFEL